MNTTLKTIIGQFLGSADQSSHQFLRLYNLGKFGLETEFNLDLTGTIKTVILDVNANKTVTLPCDYIRYMKIGELNGRGEVVTYKRNDQMTTLINSSTENRTNGAPVVTNGITGSNYFPYNWAYYNNYWYNGTAWKLFGADSGTVTRGEYKVDEKQRLIFLSSQTHNSEVVLEYLCDGFDDGTDDYDIDVRAAKAMMAYLRWVNAQDQYKKFSQGQVQGLMKDYYREKRLAKMCLNPFVLNEMEVITHASPKLVSKS